MLATEPREYLAMLKSQKHRQKQIVSIRRQQSQLFKSSKLKNNQLAKPTLRYGNKPIIASSKRQEKHSHCSPLFNDSRTISPADPKRSQSSVTIHSKL